MRSGHHCARKGSFMPARRHDPLARGLPAELQVAATNGSILTDSRGRNYIDFVMGWCVGNFGWRPAAIANALERFKGPDYVYPGYSYAPWTELARLLTSLVPRSLTTCFRATGGSEAVDLRGHRVIVIGRYRQTLPTTSTRGALTVTEGLLGRLPVRVGACGIPLVARSHRSTLSPACRAAPSFGQVWRRGVLTAMATSTTEES